MIRTTHLANITIQIPNPLMGMSFGMPVYMTHLQVVTNGDQQVGHPTQQQTPLVPADMTPEMLALLNEQLASIGLKLEKVSA